jgi:RNase H-fold protein (predicted Holliday junction resolvase)
LRKTDFGNIMTTDPLSPVVPHLVLAIDPGKDKCGVAVVTTGGEIVERHIYASRDLADALMPLTKKYNITEIVLGNATTSQRMRQQLLSWLPLVRVAMVDESGSTLQARTLYWQANPPRGWRRLAPLSMQVPPEPVDDFAAVVLAQRFLGSATTKSQGKD